MIKTKLSWTVGNIKKMYEEKKTLSFSHPIQRDSGQWTKRQMSLLVHSLLANYPVPNIYVLRCDSQQIDEKGKPIFTHSVLDGKQRLTVILSYINGDFSLEDDIPDVTIEDVTCNIGGKYFSDLDQDVQYEIMRYKFEIYAFEDCSDTEIEEIFFRLNNSTPLSKSQKAKALIGVNVAKLINELLSMKFFRKSCNFSGAQRKSNDDQRCLFQGMMVLDANYSHFELKDLCENSIMAYAESIRGNFTALQENTIRSAIEFLSDAFPVYDKNLRKIHLPMLIYMADVAMDKEIRPLDFRHWWEYFTSEAELFEVYKGFCSVGSTKLNKVKGRLFYMAKSFTNYFETDMPDEFVDFITPEELEAKSEDITVALEAKTDLQMVEAKELTSDEVQDASHVNESSKENLALKDDRPETFESTTDESVIESTEEEIPAALQFDVAD